MYNFKKIHSGFYLACQYRDVPRLLLKQLRNVQHNKRLGIGKLFDVNKIRRYKKSDTLFVLGSGPSINELSQEQLRSIEENDSFGFTNWTMHDLVPTYYMNEFKNRNSELTNCGEQELTNLVKKKNEYRNTAIILRAGETLFDEIKGFSTQGFPFANVYLALDIPVRGVNGNEMMSALNFINKIGLLNNRYILLNKTASLFRVLIFAYKLGYKNIVLCGIDLTGDLYFWEQKEEYYRNNGLIFPILTDFRDKVHKTNSPEASCGGMVISDAVKLLKIFLLDRNQINLTVASESSGLFPDIDKYSWE